MIINGLHLYLAGVLAMWVWLAARRGRPTSYLFALGWPIALLLLAALLVLDAVTPESPGDGST